MSTQNSSPPVAVQPQLQARMGYVGSVALANITKVGSGAIGTSAANYLLRVTSCNVMMKQPVNAEEVIDGAMDRVVYSMGKREVNGDIAFPLVHDGSVSGDTGGTYGCSAPNQSLAQNLWTIATARDTVGRLGYEFNVDVRYNSGAAFTYQSCVCSKLGLKVTQGGKVEVTMSVVGRGGSPPAGGGEPVMRAHRGTTLNNPVAGKGPVRVVTFNDFRIGVHYRTGSSITIGGEYIRDFSVDIDNDVEVIHTLNGNLSPQDVVAKKRKIEGNLKFMGFPNLDFTENVKEQQKFTSSQNSISFGYGFGSSQTAYWGTSLQGVIFNIEDVSVNNGLVETGVKFMAMGRCTNAYEATEIGSSGGTPRTQASGFGGRTTPAFVPIIPPAANG